MSKSSYSLLPTYEDSIFDMSTSVNPTHGKESNVTNRISPPRDDNEASSPAASPAPAAAAAAEISSFEHACKRISESNLVAHFAKRYVEWVVLGLLYALVALINQLHYLPVSMSCQALHVRLSLWMVDFYEPTMVIVGSRGLNSLRGVLLGTFSNKSPVPVMVVRKRPKLPALPRVGDVVSSVRRKHLSLDQAIIEKDADFSHQEGFISSFRYVLIAATVYMMVSGTKLAKIVKVKVNATFDSSNSEGGSDTAES